MDFQNFGMKTLEQACLKATSSMIFGKRNVEPGEPVLYFQNVQVALLSEDSRPIMARGGWGNMPLVIWEDRQEMTFALNNGVIDQIGLGILLSSNTTTQTSIKIPHKEIVTLDENGCAELEHVPLLDKPIFVFVYEHQVIQKKIVKTKVEGNVLNCGLNYAFQTVLCDYYYSCREDNLIYTMNKERFNGFFSLEGKFYAKDENEGVEHPCLLFMPKVRIVSSINLRLGERADPTMSTINVIASPDRTEYSDDTIAQIIYLDEEINGF